MEYFMERFLPLIASFLAVMVVITLHKFPPAFAA